MTRSELSRRRLLGLGVGGGAALLAGCSSGSSDEPSVTASATGSPTATPTATPTSSPSGSSAAPVRSFPEGFLLGAATSAYQVEGAAAEDGRGPSIWDTFAHEGGHIADGTTGDVAADQYHRWQDDLDLMAQLGLKAYRFSISWTRVLPTGTGKANQKGLDYYRRLVEGLNERGIAPMVTLHHWDLPQPLQDKGGWEVRDTSKRFADYAALVVERLGADVPTYLTINEPKTIATVGYLYGAHAPGLTDYQAYSRSVHHLLLGHGLAMQAMRATGVEAAYGPAVNLSPVYPAELGKGEEAVAVQDVWDNRLYLDPMLLGEYPPEELMAEVVDLEAFNAVVRDGDLEIIGQPNDVIGVQYYGPIIVDAVRDAITVYPTSQASWQQIFPEGMTDLLTRLDTDYPHLPPVWITENGRPTDTPQDSDGRYPDDDRVEFLRDHLAALLDATDAGVDVRGYTLWAFCDNFEWAEGLSQRWGIVHVDFDTLERTPKASADWYASVIARHGLEA